MPESDCMAPLAHTVCVLSAAWTGQIIANTGVQGDRGTHHYMNMHGVHSCQNLIVIHCLMHCSILIPPPLQQMRLN